MKYCFQIHPDDNVATLLEDADHEPLLVRGQLPDRSTEAAEAISMGHKVALTSIPAGLPVIKYGVPIGIATVTISAGQWVHLHNCRSRLDERSNALDVHTGVAKDTPYE